MPRYIIQSAATGRFLAPNAEDHQPEWVVSLRLAGGGVTDDLERVHQLIDDWADFDDMPQVIDLDVLGTDDNPN